MKRLIACLLCVVLLTLSVPGLAMADSAYSTTSNLNVPLEYPTSDCYYQTPLRATVTASRANGSIYFMPKPQEGNGVLGTVANGTEVTVLAEKSGYCFFTTADGRMGWNGRKFFTFLGAMTTPAPVYNQNIFYFDGGACVTLPSGFYSTNVERDRNNAYTTTYFTNYDQNMDLILTEIDTYLYYQQDSVYFNSLYSSLKQDYPNPTYDSKKATKFSLSGYNGSDIYYFQGVLSDQVIYLIKMFYPTRNRSVCDRYVEQITASFTEASNISIIIDVPSYVPSTVSIPSNPTSPYAIALRDNLVYGVSYTDTEKKDVVNKTYYSRKDSDGNRKSWYTSSTYDDPNTGYRIGFYYADGLVFFADAYRVGQHSAVTFYFWGDQLLCVHDLRNGDSKLRFAGSDTYKAIVQEFGDVYSIALKRAK